MDHVNSNPRVNNDTVYYGVYVPQEDANWSESKGQLHVYTDKSKALNIVKKYKKGRFKSSKTYTEAKVFAEHGNEQLLSSATDERPVSTNKRSATVEEKSSNFKAPKHQDTVRFRKFIESGDLDTVKQIVWENPRYLISSGDTPAILQEGSRYNALHVAVRVACRADMCELILTTVGNPEFVRLLDGEDDCSNYLDRAQILVDLYLNTPDKGLNETPLHFAVKFGLKEVVQVLVSYPQCLKTLRNKYNQIPADIICDRKCRDDEELKREIRLLLDEQFYVPVLRSEDNTMQPLIGELFSPTSPLKLNYDPISPRIEVSAFAGPMNKNQAVEFRRKWKTPPRIRNTPTKAMNISLDDSYCINSPASNTIYRLQDTEKGLERVGRDLAKEYHVAWKEYWPFLNAYADLTSEEGLSKLEQFLEQRFNHQPEQSTEMMEIEPTTNGQDPDTFCDLNALCTQLSLSSLDIVDSKESHEFCKAIEILFGDKIVLICKHIQYTDVFMLPNTSKTVPARYFATRIAVILDLEFTYPDFVIDSILGSLQKRLFHDMNDGDEEYEFFTPPSSPRSVYSSSDDEDMWTAVQGDMTFIQGNTASKLDYAVYHAISSVDLSPNSYPNIYRWRHQLRLITENESTSLFRFNTPAVPRRRLLLSSPSQNCMKTLDFE